MHCKFFFSDVTSILMHGFAHSNCTRNQVYCIHPIIQRRTFFPRKCVDKLPARYNRTYITTLRLRHWSQLTVRANTIAITRWRWNKFPCRLLCLNLRALFSWLAMLKGSPAISHFHYEGSFKRRLNLHADHSG